MKHLKVPPRSLQEAILLPNPTGKWAYGGCQFAGGEIGLGRNVGAVLSWRYPNGRKPDADALLGTLMLATMGGQDRQIGDEVGRSSYTVLGMITGIRESYNVSGRSVLLPLILRDQILRLKEYGLPEDHFRATPYELAQLGLLGRGVDRSVVAEACGIKKMSLSISLAGLDKREGMGGLASCIAGATLTRQIGATSCVPLLRTDQDPSGIKPFMPMADWNDLVAKPDVGELRGMFSELAKLRHGSVVAIK